MMEMVDSKRRPDAEVMALYFSLVDSLGKMMANLSDPNVILPDNIEGVIEEVGNAIFLLRREYDL